MHIKGYSSLSLELNTICDINDDSCSYKTGQDVITYYGFEQSWGTCIYVLVIYIFGMKFLAALSLWAQGRNKQGNLNFRENLETRKISPRAAALTIRKRAPTVDTVFHIDAIELE
jgi:hypothetical protein